MASPRKDRRRITPETSDAERAELAAALDQQGESSRLKTGDLVRGRVGAVQNDTILIALGGKSDAVMDSTELDRVPDVGDEIEAVVISVGAEVRLSARMAAERRHAVELQDAFANGKAVIGKVIARNKGGYHVAVGELHAFCPLSQIDLGQTPNPDVHLEQSYPFKILEISEGGKRVVLSRADFLRVERSKKAEETRKTIEIGKTFEGRVTSLTDYGAFVDLGGLEGLVHVSEISHRRVKKPQDVLTVGQTVTVRVTKIDEDGKRISLSIRDLEEDPWTKLPERFPAGASFVGTIVRKTDFGLFVEVEPGIDGLVHASQLPPGTTLSSPSLAPGESVRGWVRELDVAKRRLSLVLREVATGDPWKEALTRYSGRVVEGMVERIAPFGAFVLLEPGLTGLIPASDGKATKGDDAPLVPGAKVVVKVQSVDTEKKRISLSIEAAKDEAARSEYREFLGEQKPADAGQTAMAAAFAKARPKKA